MKLLVFSLVALVGCTSVYEVAPSTTATTFTPAKPRPTQPPIESTDEAGFIRATHDKAPMTIVLPDSDLLDSGYATCEGFASGMSLEDVVTVISDTAAGDAEIEDMLQWIAVNAVVYLCPEYAYKVETA